MSSAKVWSQKFIPSPCKLIVFPLQASTATENNLVRKASGVTKTEFLTSPISSWSHCILLARLKWSALQCETSTKHWYKISKLADHISLLVVDETKLMQSLHHFMGRWPFLNNQHLINNSLLAKAVWLRAKVILLKLYHEKLAIRMRVIIIRFDIISTPALKQVFRASVSDGRSFLISSLVFFFCLFILATFRSTISSSSSFPFAANHNGLSSINLWWKEQDYFYWSCLQNVLSTFKRAKSIL